MKRIATIKEERLIELLIEKSQTAFPDNWKEGLLVEEMNDGGMGSLTLYLEGSTGEKRLFGHSVSEYQFKDLDGVEVLAYLDVDIDGNLYELDIWKVDFSKLISLPDL